MNDQRALENRTNVPLLSLAKLEHGRLGCAANRRLACCLFLSVGQARRLSATQPGRPCSYAIRS
jgi:hypothetical protein